MAQNFYAGGGGGGGMPPDFMDQLLRLIQQFQSGQISLPDDQMRRQAGPAQHPYSMGYQQGPSEEEIRRRQAANLRQQMQSRGGWPGGR